MCYASKKVNNMTGNVTLSIFGMLTSDSAIEIDMALEKEDGVMEANTSSAMQQTEVSFDPKITNLFKIIIVIRKLGYEVEITNGTVQ